MLGDLARPFWLDVQRLLSRCLILTAAALAAGHSKGAAGQEFSDQRSALPLQRVVLFSSSVGYFEHRGEVEGNRQIEFFFKTSDINDLLKSLVVQDRGGGFVTTVNYGSPEPIARALSSFAIDLTQTPTLAQIFQQLRGQEVRLDVPATVTGTVVGVEARSVPQGEGGTVAVEMLNLRTDRGLQSVRIDRIESTRFLNEQTDREFQQALALVAAARRNDQKRVQLDFRGDGKRNVAVGYIQEAPVWKTSYRLVLSDHEPPFLQGWAIVENTTTQDWHDVQLTLVSGRPISFLMNLSEPLYLSRPVVKPEQHASLRPRVYDQDLAGQEKEFERAATTAVGGSRTSRARGGMGGFMGGMGGMGGGMGGGIAGGAQRSTDAGSVDPFAAPTKGESGQRPFSTAVIPAVGAAASGDGLDLRKGIAAAASVEDVGELFRYVIQAPVTLNRNQSAMLPIVNDAVKGEKVDIYNPAVHPKHPLSGLRLTNITPLHLLQGPITLFDGGEYAGDARIEDIPPGSTRLVSYSLDLETEVAVEAQPAKQVTVGLQIQKGGLHVKHKASRQLNYVVKNSSGRAKQVVVEQSIDPSWHLAEPTPVEKTRALYRFGLTAEPGQPATLSVKEEKDVAEHFVLATLMPAQLELFIQMPLASSLLKKALQDALARKTAVADARYARVVAEALLARLTEDQDRVRKNLQALPASKVDDPAAEENRKASRELTQRYLTRLGSLENELEAQRQRLESLKAEEAKVEHDLKAFLQALVVE